MTGPARRHHTVSKFYLKRFADDRDQVLTIDLSTNKQFLQNVTNASVRTDYYMAVDEVGEQTDAFEVAMSQVETAAADAWRAIDEGAWPLPADLREAAATWMGLQLLRGHDQRTMMSNLGTDLLIILGGRPQLRETLIRLGEPADDQAVNEQWVDLFQNLPTIEATTNQHIHQIAMTLPRVIENLTERWWALSRFQRKALATSDSPVVVVPNERDVAIGMGTGIETADEILCPVNRHACVSLASRATLPPYMAELSDIAQVAKTALFANSVTSRNARHYLFHHPDDEPLNGLPLPDPRSREIGLGGDPWRFMDDSDRRVLEEAGLEPATEDQWEEPEGPDQSRGRSDAPRSGQES